MSLSQQELARLPPKPVTDGYEWTGSVSGHPCVLFGDRELAFDPALGTWVLENRTWGEGASPVALGRLRRFHERIPEPGREFLASVYRDVGTELTTGGKHQAKRGGWQFHGVFVVLERGENWVRAKLVRRS
jgi:hypothetical protein